MLRLDWNLLFTVINILILYFLMKKFLLKPVNNIIAKRKEMIEHEKQQALQEREEASRLKAEYEKALQDAKKESQTILAETGKKAQTEYEQIMGEAKNRADDLIAEAARKSEAEHNKMLQNMRVQITELAMEVAGKIIGRECNDTINQSMYDEFLKKAGEKDDTESK